MFDLDRFATDCRAALAQDRGGQRALREAVARAVADPGAVLAALGESRRGEVQKFYYVPDLTILNVVWGPRMTIHPHDHHMAAVIGVYTGAEDNIFWRRVEGGKIEAADAEALRAGDCTVLGKDIIHSVTNPVPCLTGAIHVYGGDFFAAERSEWDPETLTEQRYDVAKTMHLFEESNAALAAMR